MWYQGKSRWYQGILIGIKCGCIMWYQGKSRWYQDQGNNGINKNVINYDFKHEFLNMYAAGK